MIRLVAFALVVVSSIARAEPAESRADELFHQGRNLMAAGKLAEACAAFVESQQLQPRVTTLLNLAGCRERLGQLATSLELFHQVVQLTGSDDDVAKQLHGVAEDRVRKLELRVSTLTIAVAQPVDGLEITRGTERLDPAMWNHPIPLDGGTYAIAARAPGATTWTIEVAIAVEGDHKTVEVPMLERPPPAQPTPKVVIATPTEELGLLTPRRDVALGLAGVGGVGVIAGLWLGSSAQSKHDSAHMLCAEPQTPCASAAAATALSKSSHGLSIDADVALGIGAAALIGAGVLWFTGAPASSHDVAIVPSRQGIALQGRF